MITLEEIAKRVGLTRAAVSMALRNHDRISLSTREHVRKVAQEMGYQPNILARGLKGGKTQTIGVLWSLCGPHYSQSMVSELAMRAMRWGYVTYIADSLGDPQIIARTLKDFTQRQVDGVVIQCTSFTSIDENIKKQLLRFSSVVIVSSTNLSISQDQIIQSLDFASQEVADYFIKTGRRRPAVLMSLDCNQRKIQPFWQRIRELGIEPVTGADINVIKQNRNDATMWYWQALENSFAKKFPFDALYCGTDEGAAAAIKWLQGKGFKIPQDVAVVGFNDSEFSKMVSPAIASVDRHEDEIIQAVEEMLFSRLNNPELPSRQKEIPMRFIYRESAG